MSDTVKSDGVLTRMGKSYNIKIFEWKNSLNQLHRVGYPAYISYFKDSNTVASKEWWINGKVHRLDGPANMVYLPHDIPYKYEWWSNGICVPHMDLWLHENDISIPFTSEDLMAIKLYLL